MTDQREYKALRSLYRIVEAGEKGFATAAANVSDPSMKIFLKRCAGQRARFMAEIQIEATRLGFTLGPGRSIPGMIHRGRIAIFAAMAIGNDNQERIVLKEALVGEQAALREYARVLEEKLNPQTGEAIWQQYVEVRKVTDQVRLLAEKVSGKRMVVRLFDTRSSADRAVQALRGADINPLESIHVPLAEVDLYQGKGVSTAETVLSGAFGGALWGSLTGVLVGFGIVETTSLPTIGAVLLAWLLAAVGFGALGAFVAAVLGFFIGQGTSEGDRFAYREILTRKKALLMVIIDQTQMSQAGQILDKNQRNGVQPGLSPSM